MSKNSHFPEAAGCRNTTVHVWRSRELLQYCRQAIHWRSRPDSAHIYYVYTTRMGRRELCAFLPLFHPAALLRSIAPAGSSP